MTNHEHERREQGEQEEPSRQAYVPPALTDLGPLGEVVLGGGSFNFDNATFSCTGSSTGGDVDDPFQCG